MKFDKPNQPTVGQAYYAHYGREWHFRNRERRLAQNKIRYEKNKAEILRKTKEWAKAHPEDCRMYQKNYRSKPGFKEFNRERQKRWREKNRDRANELTRLSVARHRDAVNQRQREFYRKNPDLFKLHAAKRRALKRDASVNLQSILAWMKLVKSKATAVCYYCQKRIPSAKVHFDHIVALSKGGAHSVENLCVSCKQCNLSKNNKPVQVWIKTGQQLLEL